MAVEKKRFRFPKWLWAGSIPLVILAAVLGFIETVGHQGTLVGCYEQIKPDMSAAEVARIVGRRPFLYAGDQPAFIGPVPQRQVAVHTWEEEGPVTLYVEFEGMDQAEPRALSELKIIRKSLSFQFHLSGRLELAWWHMRRWAEQTYTAIHGPRPLPPDRAEFHSTAGWWR